MKKYTLYLYATIAALAIGCADFGDTNVSPNASKTPLTSALLTNALSTLGNTVATGANVTTGLYCQYYSEILYTDASRYSVQDIDWAGELAGGMYDLQNIININSDPATAEIAGLNGSNNNQIAIARILKAYRFSVLTDRYGDMPYSEALTENTQPVFDTQQAIYTDLFKELKEAVAQFDAGPSVKGDILFDGDNTKWKKFANSLRVILAVRISNADAALGQAQFNDALSSDGGVLELDGNSDPVEDVVLKYYAASNAFSNPYYYAIAGDFNICSTIANFLNTNGDRRNNAFGVIPAGKSALVGVPPGLQRQDAIDFTANNPDHSLVLAESFRMSTSPVVILSTADVLLAKAEAAQMNWFGGNKTQLYADGIKASWKRWNVYESGAYDAYMANANIDLTLNPLVKIQTQRWLSFFPNGSQGWSEWRRTGIPVLTPSPVPANTSGEIPVRFIYPTIEYGLNGDKLEAAVAIQGTDNSDTHVWWDK